MKLYGAIDLHSNNNVTVLTDETDKVVYQKRLTNDLPLILEQLSPYTTSIEGIVVESTYNWYWLVDGLMEKGHRVHLANTAAIQQYEGLKYTDDDSDARWLAHLFRLGVLPEGYIYPKEERAVRDLLRKRSQLVRQKTANILSIQNLYFRNTGSSINANRIKQLSSEKVDALFSNANLALAVKANLTVMRSLETEIAILERVVKEKNQTQGGVSLFAHGERHRADPGVDDHAGDWRHQKICEGGKLCFVLPVRGEREAFQRQTQRQWQHKKWEQVSLLGICGGSEFCDSL